MNIRIKGMCKRTDMDDVLTIENCLFPLPWSLEDFTETINGGARGICAVDEFNAVVGYSVFETDADHISKKQSEAILYNLAVDEAYQRQGIATKMLEYIRDYGDGHDEIAMIVRESNLAALNFFKHLGFLAARGMVRNHYADTGEDGIVMQWRRKDAS